MLVYCRVETFLKSPLLNGSPQPFAYSIKTQIVKELKVKAPAPLDAGGILSDPILSVNNPIQGESVKQVLRYGRIVAGDCFVVKEKGGGISPPTPPP